MTTDTIPNPPDFVIAGAMKSGTTWLHRVLDCTNQVSIPDEEVHLFDYSDYLTHPDFCSHPNNTTLKRTPTESQWWRSSKAPSFGRLKGWDSSTLFHSFSDFGALAELYPRLKLLIVLRDPTDRCYSHYWHLVRTGRATKRFEDEILNGKQEILLRSIYRDQAQKIYEAFGVRSFFISYETMMTNKTLALESICSFLEISLPSLESLDIAMTEHHNPAVRPNFLPGWLIASRLLSSLKNGKYTKELGRTGSIEAFLKTGVYKLKLAAMVTAGLGYSRKRPVDALNINSRAYLDAYFKRANYGLERIIPTLDTSTWYKSS